MPLWKPQNRNCKMLVRQICPGKCSKACSVVWRQSKIADAKTCSQPPFFNPEFILVDISLLCFLFFRSEPMIQSTNNERYTVLIHDKRTYPKSLDRRRPPKRSV